MISPAAVAGKDHCDISLPFICLLTIALRSVLCVLFVDVNKILPYRLTAPVSVWLLCGGVCSYVKSLLLLSQGRAPLTSLSLFPLVNDQT